MHRECNEHECANYYSIVINFPLRRLQFLKSLPTTISDITILLRKTLNISLLLLSEVEG